MNTGSLKHVTIMLKNAEKNPTPSGDLISRNRSWDGRATLGLEKKLGWSLTTQDSLQREFPPLIELIP